MQWIDFTRLTALRDDIGDDGFCDVAALFVDELNEHLGRLLANPVRATAADFHFLRGSAANMGFTALVTACETAEAACRSGAAPDLEALKTAFHGAVDEVRKVLPSLSSAA